MAPKVTSRWAHAAEISAVAYAPDGSCLITASEDDFMHLFPEGKANSTADKLEHEGAVTCLIVTKEHIFTGSADGCIRQYDLREQQFMGIIVKYELAVRCMAISHDRNILAVGTESADIKIIVLEDREKGYPLRGHKKALSSLSFDPQGEFLVSSSCDGTVKVWNLKEREKVPVDSIPVGEPVSTDSQDRIPVLWHPSSEFFAIGKGKDIVVHNRLTWKYSFKYRSGTEHTVRTLAWSPNGKFLAASSSEADLWVWQYKEKENPLASHKHKSGCITALAWAPNANRLRFTDTTGELSCWEEVIEEGKGSPFNQPKQDPLEGLFDDSAAEDAAAEDQEMTAPEYLSDNESLNDFIVDDENNNGYLEKRPPGVVGGSKSAQRLQAVKELHPAFQSGSTVLKDERRYLAFNLLGLITTVDHGTHATISVEFHDKLTQRGYHFTDNNHYSMACLGMNGALFAAASSDGNPSTVFYKTSDSWATKSEWQIYLPDGEDATSVALNAESAIVTTSRGYVRVFSQSGIQTGLFGVGPVISSAGKGDLVLLVHHQGEPFQGSQNLGYSMYNVETGQRIQQGVLPVSDDTFISWIGFSEGGIPAFYDDKGVMHVLNYYRRVDQGQWTPILDTGMYHLNLEPEARPYYWPIGLTDQTMSCVRCKKGEVEPATIPKPFLTELPLKMPTLYQESASGQHEEGWLRTRILSGLNKDEKIATTASRDDDIVARKELEMDKLVLQMIDLACKSDRTQKAQDLTAMLCNLRSIDAAIKIAHHHNLHSLMERMNWVKEIKMKEEENRDPEAEAELIMANPVLAEKQTRDHNASRLASRAEEQELERRTFQRKDPVAPNDPFGRRVVKEGSFSRANGQGSSASAANPFKKKSANSDGGSRGFGLVKEIEGTALPLPLIRRATDVFQAADYLAADEQRSKADREKASRQEDSLRKRKANGPTVGGGQKTLDIFSKASTSAGSNSVADAKRFKRQEEEAVEESEADRMMDADDFLEEEEEAMDEREDSMPPLAQVIPTTQYVRPTDDEGDLFETIDDSVEVTRERLEKSQMQASSSPSPPKPQSSSSVLAGFKFSK
ncbi:chromosome transmission fidelity protein 4 [Entomortierella parvispora]|uniref:Chromosome transmission fidelity protein 4 n=1 Tax=Entomortierella parvispora TaxID=205924 RepID=A0A9P3H591_9FUNG|nr:chromosome transmission fidelity protein 4 [Entomortierella parvispora]